MASLGLPDCPPGRDLVVNTAEDQLDGGVGLSDPAQAGPELSFFEALFIASHLDGQKNILFDPVLFPPDAPREIVLQGRERFPQLRQTCIDGRDRGVILRWDFDAESGGPPMPCCPDAIGFSTCHFCTSDLIQGSRMQGLTLLDVPDVIEVYASVIAGCRIGTDGHRVRSWASFYVVDLASGSTLGPGNAVVGLAFGVYSDSGSEDVLVVGNDFGHDPVTGALFPLQWDVQPRGPMVIAGNVLTASWKPLDVFFVQIPDTEVVFKGNRLGVDRQGRRLDGVNAGVFIDGPGFYTVGPQNIFTGLAGAIYTQAPSRVHITRNSIYANQFGIAFQSATPVPAPQLVRADRLGAVGRCAVGGLVEVFSDRGDQGERFLGEAPCTPGVPWSLSGEIPAGRNVTATLTDAEGRTSAFSSPLPVP